MGRTESIGFGHSVRDGVCVKVGLVAPDCKLQVDPREIPIAVNQASVTGGTFDRSYDGVSHTDAGYWAKVGDFRLDTFEVTVGRFRKFVESWPSSKLAVVLQQQPSGPIRQRNGNQVLAGTKIDIDCGAAAFLRAVVPAQP